MILQDILRYCKISQDIERYLKMLQDIARYCKISQDIARYLNILQDISRYCMISQGIPRYFKIIQEQFSEWSQISERDSLGKALIRLCTSDDTTKLTRPLRSAVLSMSLSLLAIPLTLSGLVGFVLILCHSWEVGLAVGLLSLFLQAFLLSKRSLIMYGTYCGPFF